MALLWQKTMSVENDAIDHDHRYLISFINTIELVLQSPEDKKSIMDALDQLEVVKEKIKGLNSAGEISKYAPELTTYLRSWLINHVFNEDMLLKPYLLKYPRWLY